MSFREKSLAENYNRIKNPSGFLNENAVNEGVDVSAVRSRIAKLKAGLIDQWNKYGGHENFGQDAVRALQDKYHYNPYGTPDERAIANLIDEFDNWAQSYDGSGNVDEAVVLEVSASLFKTGDLVFCKDMGRNGLVGLVLTDETMNGDVNVFFRRLSGEAQTINTKNDSVEDVYPKYVYSTYRVGDTAAYLSIAKKRGITLNPKYLKYDSNDVNEFSVDESESDTTLGKNGYVAFYRGRRIEVYADSSYQAQQLAAKEFGVSPSKSYEVTVKLAEKDGQQLTHVPDF